MSDLTADVLAICDAALTRPEAERSVYLDEACAGDIDLRRSVESVLGVMTEASDAISDSMTLWTADDLIGREIGGFRLTEKLGEGGMGAVFRAERTGDGFAQDVAIKLIRGQFTSVELIRRFDAERAILAGLNHPYIASLIDGGTDQGTPYIVMEYIDGLPIDEYCDTRRLGIGERIALLQKVAQAVHAAHQNLIIHRDLKPSNVLVTDDGIPKLLDFGIAKAVDADEPGSTTLFGHSALTPDFASPEQILKSKATTVSDVYSLGVLTYQLLAGVRPYRLAKQEPQEAFDTLQNRRIASPSDRFSAQPKEQRQAIASARSMTVDQLPGQLRGDLDTIVLKALATDPSQRYSSVAAFSADLKRWTQGDPIEARPATWSYRTGRLIARNRLAAGLTMTLVVALLAGLLITLKLYFDAEAARQDAAQRFDEVRELASTMMFDLYDEVASIPGTVSARQTLAETAQKYLGRLAGDADTAADFRLEAARGYARLSNILNRDAVDDSDERNDAENAYQQAVQLLARLHEEQPDDAQVLRTWGMLESRRGQSALIVDNDTELSARLMNDALQRLTRAKTLSPSDLDIAIDWMTATTIDAERLQWSNDYENSIATAMRTAQAAQLAFVEHDNDARLPQIAANALRTAAESAYFADELEIAESRYTDAVEQYRIALNNGGPDTSLDDGLAVTLWSRGNTRIDLGNPEAASEDYAKAIALTEVAVVRDPDDLAQARRLAILRGSQAMAMVQTNRATEGIALMKQTNQWFEQQVEKEPDTPGAHRSLAVSYYVMGDVYRNAGDVSSSCEWFTRSLNRWELIQQRFGLAEFDAGEPDRIRGELAECQSAGQF